MADPPALWALAEEWLDERQTIGRGLSANSEAAYRRDLMGWAWRIAELTLRPPAPGHDGHDGHGPAGFVPELSRIEAGDLSAANVRQALASLAREGRSPATRARMLASLRGFCGWLVREGHLAADPTADLQNPKPADRQPVALLPSELRAVLEAASTLDPHARFPWPERDRALVAVLAGTGVRASELAGLEVRHLLREEAPVLRVIGKGNKERRVPVPVEVVEAVDAYLESRAHRLGGVDPTARLFVRYNGGAFTRESINYHVYRWLARAGVHKPEGEAAHLFRHTYAKGLVARGVPISTVQKLLGHASLSTTEIYLRMTAVELQDAAQAAEIRQLLRDVPAGG